MPNFPTILALLAALSATTASASPVGSLDQPGLQEAFQYLRSRYIRSDELTPLTLNRAALSGVLASLDFGAELIQNDAPASPPLTKFAESTLPTGTAYLRPATFSASELPAFESALQNFASSDKEIDSIILDLRAPAAHGSFQIAAAYADRLLPPDLPLFELTSPTSKTPRTFRTSRESVVPSHIDLQILIDADSNNVAETLAALLKKHRSAFLIGQPTPGRTVEYETLSLSPEVQLRLATAEMVLEDGTTLFRTGLTPDLAIPSDPIMKAAAFATGSELPLSTFVQENQRPRFNEAALIHGTYPEFAYLADRTAGRESPIDRAPQIDPVLQRAVELIAARAALTSGTE